MVQYGGPDPIGIPGIGRQAEEFADVDEREEAPGVPAERLRITDRWMRGL